MTIGVVQFDSRRLHEPTCNPVADAGNEVESLHITVALALASHAQLGIVYLKHVDGSQKERVRAGDYSPAQLVLELDALGRCGLWRIFASYRHYHLAEPISKCEHLVVSKQLGIPSRLREQRFKSPAETRSRGTCRLKLGICFGERLGQIVRIYLLRVLPIDR